MKLAADPCPGWDFDQDVCMTCGICSSACPVSGVDGFDPRKLVRMALLGRTHELVEARWPWICTMCGKCEQLCPMGVRIADLVRRVRSLRARESVPGILHKGIEAALQTGNNLRLPKEDFLFILEDVAGEIREEPGFTNLQVQVDTHTEDLKHWWKIFHAAGESWTVASDNWEGTSWGYFTGDDAAMKTMAGRILKQMEELKIDTLLWPE
jgi:heterodisulfide reductase subunit C